MCPRCHARLELRDHTPVLHLYEERGDARYEPVEDAWIAGTEGRKLYPWHVASSTSSTSSSGIATDGEIAEAVSAEDLVMAEVEYDDGIWGLRNRGLDELRVIRNGRVDRVVAVGELVTLHDGLTLLLAPAPHGRAIVVSRFEH